MTASAEGTRATSFARQVVGVASAQAVAQVLLLVNAALVSRHLGPEGKGVVTLVLTTRTCLEMFFSGGLGPALTALSGRRGLPLDRLLGMTTTLLLGLSVGAVATGAALISAGFLRETVGSGLVMTLVSVPLLLGLLVLRGGLHARGRMDQLGIVVMLEPAVTTVATAWTMRDGVAGADDVLTAYAVGVGAAFVVAALLLARQVPFRPRWHGDLLRPLLAYGPAAQLGTVLHFLTRRVDVFLVHAFLGPGATGIYSVAVAAADVAWYLPNAAALVLFQRVSQLDEEAARPVTARSAWVALAAAVVIALVLLATGQVLLPAIFSPPFAAAYPPLLVLLAGAVVLAPARILLAHLAGVGRPLAASMAAAAGLVTLVVLDLALIPRYGVLGAAAAASGASCVIAAAAIACVKANVLGGPSGAGIPSAHDHEEPLP